MSEREESRYPATVRRQSAGESNRRYPQALSKERCEEIERDMADIIREGRQLGPLPDPMLVPREALP